MCLRPQTYQYIDGDRKRVSVSGPCGYCIDCLKDYQNMWKIRLSEEFAVTCKGVFFTLTYDPVTAPPAIDYETGEIIETDEYTSRIETNDPVAHSLRQKDVVDWFKRSREAYARSLGYRPKIKYFICGEYGPRTLRPHYHGVIFGIDYPAFQMFFQNDWQTRFGFVDSSRIKYDNNKSPQRVANYVSKYCSKGQFENPRVVENPGCFEKPRRIMSKGLGKAKALQLRDEILGKDFVDPYISAKDFALDVYSKTPVESLVLNVDMSKSKQSISKQFRYYGPRPRSRFRPGALMIKNEPELRYSCTYSTIFLDKLIDKLSVNYYDQEKNKTYRYKFPRYYTNIILGERTPLALQVKERLQVLSVQRDVDELEKLQTANPRWSPLQTYRAFVSQTMVKKQVLAAQTYKTLSNFYQLSAI